MLTAAGGYPSDTWGADGFSVALTSPAAARQVVADLAADGVDLVKVAVEPAGGRPVPGREELRTVVSAVHEAGLRVSAHALTAAAVARVLDAGADELAHTPTERLDDALVARLAATGTVVGRLVGLPGRLSPGGAARLVVLPADPLVQPEAWRAPLAVLTDGRLLTRTATQ